MTRFLLPVLLGVAACYSGAVATHDINASWRGRTRAEIEGRWGRAGEVREDGRTTSLQWWYRRVHRYFVNPPVQADVTTETGADAQAAAPLAEAGAAEAGRVEVATVEPGVVVGAEVSVAAGPVSAGVSVEAGTVATATVEPATVESGTVVVATAEPATVQTTNIDVTVDTRPIETVYTVTSVMASVNSGVVTSVAGDSLPWGPPNDANLHWGAIFGAHAGMGRLDDTETPMPSGGAYIGGMLSRTFALVGCFSMATGTGDAGWAMGFGWGFAAQWWPLTRLWLRAGPALAIDFQPGFEDLSFSMGATVGASVAMFKFGNFVVDLRFDLVETTSALFGRSMLFGTVGVGANLN